MARPRHSGLAWAEAIVSALARRGVDTWFIGTGSRSTPLVLAVSRRSTLTSIVHVDERAAAFAALGFARASGRPAAVITTSGTAVANLLPAVVEAAMDAQPLVVLSADRPPELRGKGANQTIDQVNIFGRYARYFSDVSAPDGEVNPDLANTIVSEALSAATGSLPGPVHINCMFREPLAPPYAAENETPAEYSDSDPSDRHAIGTQESVAERASFPRTRMGWGDDPSGIVAALAGTRRGLVMAGRLNRASDARAIERLADQLGWPLLADIGSQVHRAGNEHVVTSFDQILLSGDIRDRLRPDTVLHVGGSYVSKRFGLWLAEATPLDVIHVSDNELPYDPFGVVTRRFRASAGGLGRALAESEHDVRSSADPDWAGLWIETSRAAETLLAAELDGAVDGRIDGRIDEPSLARMIWRAVPRGWSLLVGNSMPVRDFDAFGWGSRGPQFVASNRGASGIDGLVATAFGVAVGRNTPVIAVVGDQSLLHDLGSLLLVARSAQPVVIVVVNNGGGGIFSFLPIVEHRDVFEDWFAAAHTLKFRAAAEQFSLAYENPGTCDALQSVLEAAFIASRSMLIEVNTDRAENRAVHDRIADRFRALPGGRA